MTIADKKTYGDYYWAAQVEAAKLVDEISESALAPLFSGLLGTIPEISELPAGIQSFLNVLREPASAGTGMYAAAAAGEFASETIRDLIKPGMSALGRVINRGALETWLDPVQAVSLFQRRKIDDTYFDLLMTSAGYETSIAKQVSDSIRPYPAIAEIMRYARYHGNPENTRDTVWEKFDVPADDYDMFEWLTLQVLSTEQIHRLFRREVISDYQADNYLQQVGWRGDNVGYVKELGWLIPNPMLLTQGNLHQGVRKEQILKDISRGDIHPDHAQQYLDAILTKPATQDVVTYTLRTDPGLQSLDERLTRIGIHPDYLEMHKELANVIPPVADIITMAVREVFTPAIAARFGQYDDFPAPLEEWGLKKGLSKEWSQRYWAAHWALPSASQGFEMLHRGVIDRDDLNRLLRAQDVMPFWRDKLTQIAFRPLTRVDVRRMYREGILDEAGVYEAYLDHGYAEENAKRMTDFTIKQTLSAQAKFTSTDVVAAFAKRMIDRGEARSLLAELGIASQNISYIISRAEYKRLWDLTESRIAGIKNLYKKGVYDEDAARAKLLQLNLPSDEVNVLFEQWWYEKNGELAPTWTKAETIKFAKAGTITKSRAWTELQSMGYDAEHITVYLEQIE
ncbi:hypothetical protein LCGC14_0994750 [marine sediment metagenome]|uniref:Uncharacterized protein n=1 Tax=marine sediment metagenome TaxID=412755 RepID=A0A0F9N9C3_9ZZZZ